MLGKQGLASENVKLLLLPTLKTEKTLCQSFVFEPEKDKKSLGQLILLVKIDQETKENQEVLRGIVEIAKSEFYSDPKREVEESLESSLIKVNQVLKELATLGKIDWVNKLHAVIACLYNKNLILTQTGKVSSILIRNGEAHFISPDLDLEKPSQPQKTFIGLTSGKLKSNDYLILATESLLEFFSPEKLVQILEQKKIQEAKTHIQKLISEQIGDKETVGTILLAVDPSGKQKKVSPAFPKMERIEKFPEEILEASEVEEVKTPERIQEEEAIQRRLRARRGKKFPYNFLYGTKNACLLLLRGGKMILKYSFKHGWPLFKKTLAILYLNVRKTANQIAILSKKIYLALRRKRQKKQVGTEIVEAKPAKKNVIISKLAAVPAIPLALARRFQNLNLRRKIVFTTLPVIILVLIFSLAFLARNKTKTKDVARSHEEVLEQAESKRRQALDAMIYKDENKAREILEEVDNLLGQVLGSETHREQVQGLQAEIRDQFDTINKVTRISDPLLLTNIAKINPNLTPLKLVGLGSQIYTLCSENNTILRLDPEKQETIQVSPNFANIGHLALASEIDEGKNIIFTNQDNEFALFDIEAFKIEKIDAPSSLSPNSIRDLAYYAKKIYTLNPEQNQIVKYGRSISGLSKGAEWLREGDIQDGVSFSIDSDIYVLTANGKILKFRGGRPAEFPDPDLAPPLVSPNKIFTKTGYKYLYILDPPNKRVIVLDKEENRLVNQFVSDKFENLKDIWVNPGETLLYILADKNIWEIENKGE